MDVLERTLMTIGCADCAAIPKVADAGRIVPTPDGPVQIMHNGLKVVAGGYYGDWMTHVIRALRGHHEPQEELLFDRIVNYARHNSLIVELGSFWSYYSLWYLDSVPGSRAICVEPDAGNLEIGRRNATLNGLATRIAFHNACIGKAEQQRYSFRTESTQEDVILPCFNMDTISALCGGETIEVLHIDAQGAELPFLQSMSTAVGSGAVRFLVTSTHHSSISGSKTTHQDCLQAIRAMNGRVLVEHDVQESFSGDGLIVASFFDQDRNVAMPAVSRNVARNSLFPEP
jgi:FkbM family methyltransferase